MELELNYAHEEKSTTHSNINTFEDIMSSLYIDHAHSFLAIEEQIRLPYWKRFSYFYTINAIVSTGLLLPSTHTPLVALAMTVPAIAGLLFALDKKSSATIFSMFGFINKNNKIKTALSNDIKIYKEDIAIPILKIKKNQHILLEYYAKFYEDNKYCLSDTTLEEIESLKHCFEQAEEHKHFYHNALDHIYNLYKKVLYAKNFKEAITD